MYLEMMLLWTLMKVQTHSHQQKAEAVEEAGEEVVVEEGEVRHLCLCPQLYMGIDFWNTKGKQYAVYIIKRDFIFSGSTASEPKPASRGRGQKSSSSTQSRSIMQGTNGIVVC